MWRTLMREMVARAALPLAHVGVRERDPASCKAYHATREPETTEVQGFSLSEQ